MVSLLSSFKMQRIRTGWESFLTCWCSPRMGVSVKAGWTCQETEIAQMPGWECSQMESKKRYNAAQTSFDKWLTGVQIRKNSGAGLGSLESMLLHLIGTHFAGPKTGRRKWHPWPDLAPEDHVGRDASQNFCGVLSCLSIFYFIFFPERLPVPSTENRKHLRHFISLPHFHAFLTLSPSHEFTPPLAHGWGIVHSLHDKQF